MVLSIFILVIGLILLVKGADWLVAGAGGVAKRAGVSEFVIGLTIVATGTSLPELVVSLVGILNGSSDIAVGNVVGSNIFNTLLILGVTALILPMTVTRQNMMRDIPMNMVIALIVAFGFETGAFNTVIGLILLVLFFAYMYLTLCTDTPKTAEEDIAIDIDEPRPVWQHILAVVAGGAALVFGGRLFVSQAVTVLGSLGVPDKVTALTVLAGGTSAPELATCIVASLKKKSDIAFGNIIGSNIANVLLILGSCAAVRPLSFDGLSRLEMTTLLGSAALLMVLCTAKLNERKESILGRFAGFILLAGFAVYMFFLWQNL